MKKMLTLTAALCLTSLFMENASAFEVIFTNSSTIKGSLTATIGANCPNSSGNKNTWQSPSIYDGTVVIGHLPCDVTSSSWNDGVYRFTWDSDHESGYCEVTSADDVDTILKNGYTQVSVTVIRPCDIKRVFK